MRASKTLKVRQARMKRELAVLKTRCRFCRYRVLVEKGKLADHWDAVAAVKCEGSGRVW